MLSYLSYNNTIIYNKLFNYFPHAIFYPENEDQVSYLILKIDNKSVQLDKLQNSFIRY